jgi:hypothetical protein
MAYTLIYTIFLRVLLWLVIKLESSSEMTELLILRLGSCVSLGGFFTLVFFKYSLSTFLSPLPQAYMCQIFMLGAMCLMCMAWQFSTLRFVWSDFPSPRDSGESLGYLLAFLLSGGC